jgi:hypothetical protein
MSAPENPGTVNRPNAESKTGLYHGKRALLHPSHLLMRFSLKDSQASRKTVQF